MIYLDNAATSFPKPPQVGQAIVDFLAHSAGNPGRAGHALAAAAAGIVADTRRQLATMFGVPDPTRIVFALNATDALNTALWGLLRPGDRVITSSVEHNSVVRPLTALAGSGVTVVRLPCALDGSLNLDDLSRELRAGPTRLVALTHASNVCGTILPIAEAAELAHRHGALFLVDAAQTAGVLPIDVTALGIDLLAFPGHKGLLGPTGTGGLYVAPELRLTPLRQGGTGTRSEQEHHPKAMPEALEPGTVNTTGIAGLGAALQVLQDEPIGAAREHEAALTAHLLDGLAAIPGLHIHGPADPARQVAVVSITLDGWEPVDLGAALDSAFGIAARPGLHCAATAHKTLGTHPRGTLRLSPGPYNTGSDIDQTVGALRELAAATA